MSTPDRRARHDGGTTEAAASPRVPEEIPLSALPFRLHRWELVEMLAWCRCHGDTDEPISFLVDESDPSRITITADRAGSSFRLVADSASGRLLAPHPTGPEAPAFWSDILRRALEGKIERGIHRNLFRCRVCEATVQLRDPLEAWSHLNEHEIRVEAMDATAGMRLRLKGKWVGVDRFFSPEDGSIH